jgi:hypothetical protein
VFNRGGRKEAKQRAAAWAEGEFQRQWSAAQQQHDQWLRYYDERWRLLCANDPTVVIETLEEAFEDNEAPSAAVGVDGDEVALVVLVPRVELAVPEQVPSVTQAGNISVRKITQGDRAAFYKLFVCGHVLVTVREAFAVAPGLGSARVVILRNDGNDAYGNPRMSCLIAARFERQKLVGIQWATADAGAICDDASTELVTNQVGRTKELGPIDLAKEPELAQLLGAVDLAELATTPS